MPSATSTWPRSTRPAATCAGSTDESEALGGDARQRAREVDLLRYQIEEIDGGRHRGRRRGRPAGGEEDRLAEADGPPAGGGRRPVGGRRGRTRPSALDRLAEASRALAGRAPLAPIEARVRSTMAELSDLAAELRTVVETWEDDPERLEAIRSRRQLLRQLERKYGSDLAEVLAFAADARDRLAAIEPRGAAGLRRSTPRSGRPGRPSSTAESTGRRRPAGGRPAPGRRDRGHPARPGHALGPVRGRGGRARARRPGRASCWGPTPASRCSRWPRWPPAASWPGPCWRSGWPSPAPRG